MSNGPTEGPGGQQRVQPNRVMSNQMGIYYCNCAMIATSPKDVALFFGRYIPGSNEKGEQTLTELYERQVYMTVEQAEELASTLTRTVEAMKSRRAGVQPGDQPPIKPVT